MKDFGLKPKDESIDAWREVAAVDNFSIEIIAKEAVENDLDHLFSSTWRL
jgi:hypothetical protein